MAANIDSSVHVVTDPTSVITSAAYLLFYRRRSSGPLGGPRFKEILDKFDKEADHSENEMTESAEEGIITQQSTKTTVTPLTGTEDNEELPGYVDNLIRRSIEDDGNYQAPGSGGLDMTQRWSFTGLGSNGANGPADADADCASDDAQFESSGDDRDKPISEQDTDMASAGPFEDGASWDNGGVISVPADGAAEGASEEVTEIHLETDKTARNN
jgi:ubiquitin carboxyl-terminal hydrolase 4/11/15